MTLNPAAVSGDFLTIETDVRGTDILHDPLLNKGTAFTDEERREFGLEGLLPSHVSTLAEQLMRVKKNYDNKSNDIEKYIFLRSLQDRNEVLFYALLRNHISEMLPIVYTPTVGEAVQRHGQIYRIARGLFISPANVDSMDDMAAALPSCNIEIIVATDGQGILGIGDQGVGGMAISIGKLSLYSVGAGIHPSTCLPITLDVGTDNVTLLGDPLYLGGKGRRITGKEYTDFIRKFVEGVKRNFPGALLQWEDFSKQNAFNNLDSYRKELLSFNDDVQGTGAVVLGGIFSALKVKGQLLKEQKLAIYGAGAAGIGIARQLLGGLIGDGLTKREALDRLYVIDSAGLLLEGREKGIDEYKKEFAKPAGAVSGWAGAGEAGFSMEETIKNAGITVLIGVSGRAGAFNETVVNLMMKNSAEPMIFPLSNPTSKAEADPRWLLEYTKGAAIVSSGSPFPSVTVQGRDYRIGQGNNAFIFPGLGLGMMAARATEVTDSLFTAAAGALAQTLPESDLKSRCIYPQMANLFDVSFNVALAVYKKAVEEGTGVPAQDKSDDEAIRERMWIPQYPALVPKR